jgi:hypothetical protein
VSIQTTVRCNKCGTTIRALSPHWTATLVDRTDPDASVPAVYLYPQPTRVDICIECVQEVLGELISDARGDSPPKEPTHIQAPAVAVAEEGGRFVVTATQHDPSRAYHYQAADTAAHESTEPGSTT